MTRPPPPAELLLGRPEFAGDLRSAALDVARGRRLLVTGAAGSVGWPLAQVLVAADPAALVLVDQHEYSLFKLERALGAVSTTTVELLDIRDARRLAPVFERQRPEVVFHLAATKHVPYGERFPEEAVTTNVLATADVLELARTHAVRTLVYPSSDKSVEPPSLYGATKRLAEALVHSAAGTRCWCVVRFVNIVGTRGSVIETFTDQIKADGPLSVTDGRMTRYWISMDEALWSLLSAAASATSGEVVMPACGDAVPLLETARRLAGWYRPERVPYPITCTGIRPGERLHEVLLSAHEAFGEGPASGLRAVRRTRPMPFEPLPGLVQRLRELVSAGEREALAAACLRAARELQ